MSAAPRLAGRNLVATSLPTGADPGDVKRLMRFMRKVKVDAATGCWLWIGALQTSGYGVFGSGQRLPANRPGRNSPGVRTVLAHRWSYELHNGAIPSGMTLDHRCRVRNCVAPHHLDVLSIGDNIRLAHEVKRLATHPARGAA